MKKYGMIRLALIVLLALFIATGCQSSQAVDKGDEAVVKPEPAQQKEAKAAEPAEAVPAGPSPNIVVTKASHDFGKIGPATSHKANYKFQNDGEGDLLVKNIKSTCGCSKPTLIKDEKRFAMPMKEPLTFKPGESGQVEVTYKASSVKGSAKKHLYIESNDPDTPRAQLELAAEVEVKVTIEPETVDLKLDAENAGMPDIVVKSIDEQEFSITSVYVAQKAIDIPFDAAAKATEFTLKPSVNVEKLGSSRTGVIQIKTTHPQSGTLMVRYNIKPMYELTNPRYILQNVEPGKSVFRENLIRSNYGKKAEIESWKSRNGYMDVEKQEQDGDHIKLTIKITPPDQTDQNSTKRRYITDELTIVLKSGDKLTIRCSGWFRKK